MDINEVYNTLKYRASKGGYNSYISPDDFNLIFNKAQLRYFNKLYLQYAATQRISDALSKFVSSPVVFNLTAGIGLLSQLTGLIHITAVTYQNKAVKRVESDRLGNNLSSSYDAPTTDFPIYIQYDTQLMVYPVTIASVNVTYLKKPIDVKWAYTLSGGRPVYDQGNSIQPNWYDSDIDGIIFMALEDFGINSKADDVEQYAMVQAKNSQ